MEELKDKSKSKVEERGIDKLARYIILAAAALIILGICWVFRSIIIYIILAAVLSLLGRPIMKLLKKITIKGKCAPSWLLSIITLFLLILLFLGIVTQIIPVVYKIVQDVSSNLQSSSLSTAQFMSWLDKVNYWMIDKFPALGVDFKVQDVVLNWLKDAFDFSAVGSSITSVVGSVASAIGSFGMGLFCVVFISFFFIKDETLFRKIVGSVVPDSAEDEAIAALGDIEHLLTRYFVGITIEILGVALIDFIGLWAISKIGFTPAIGIAFMAGLLNIIPYVGPWIGTAIGVSLGLVIKYSSAAALGVFPNFWVTGIVLLAIFLFSQMVDNTLLQPFIYSTSVKSTPLEIFLVLIVAGNFGGIVGMLIAVPVYTVFRCVAAHFFKDFKPIKRLLAASEGQGELPEISKEALIKNVRAKRRKHKKK